MQSRIMPSIFFAAGRARRGFTLIEVVVVIAVIGLLMALVLVAVQSARESARKAACSNNLRQIGLAMQSYMSSNGAFPPGISSKGYSFLAALLPDLDERPLYDGINFQILIIRAKKNQNRTAARTAVGVFICPSDPAPRSTLTNYAGCRGGGVSRFGYNGAFPFEPYGPPTASSFTDGLSMTVASTEWVGGTSNPANRDSRRVVFQTPEALLKPSEFDRFTAACQALELGSAHLNSALQKGNPWIRGDFSFTLYNHALPINDHSCTNGTLVQEGVWTAGSDHPGGANSLFADGHVRFLRASMAIEVWRAIASRNGAEVIKSEDL